MTTPVTRLREDRWGSKPLPGIGATFDVAARGQCRGLRTPLALTTTVFEPAVEPADALADPQRNAAAENGGDKGTAASGPTRIGSL